MDQLRPELDNVLQSLSANGYSVFSLINDILACCNWKDERIKILREGMERDAADICTRLLSYITSGPERVLQFGRVKFKNHIHTAPIDILPDNVFLDIFNFCIDDHTVSPISHARSWQTLVHVCKRWRELIFTSPRRLDLHLHCTNGTPVRKNLALWPAALPLIINYSSWAMENLISPKDEDNIVAALEQPSRVRRIMIRSTPPLMKRVTIALRKPFPALEYLDLESHGYPDHALVIPRRFSRGSAPRLQHLRLNYISFSQLPRFSLSAHNLVTLRLEDIPPTPDISPDDMVRSLAMLTRLTTLSISFEEDIPSDQWTSPPDPPVLAILPVLTHFDYVGWTAYLEILLARIDAPRVSSVAIDYFVQDIWADQLSRFIERTENLKIDQFTQAKVLLHVEESCFELNSPLSPAPLSLKISGLTDLLTQILHMADLLGRLATVFSKVDNLFIRGDYAMSRMDIAEWTPLFRLFPAVKKLGLSGGMAALIASALENAPEDLVTDVFPALRLIWLIECEDEDEDEGEEVGSMERYLSLRQRFGCPVSILDMDEFIEAEQRQQEIFL